MGRSRNADNAAVKDAQITSNEEECALDMGQSRNDAAPMDAQIKPNEEDCAGDMERIAILMTNLLHSLYMGQRMMKRL